MEQEEGIASDQNGLLIDAHADIQAAALALEVVEDLDPLLLNDEDAKMVQGIRRMALKITYDALWEIYQLNLYASEDNEPT